MFGLRISAGLKPTPSPLAFTGF